VGCTSPRRALLPRRQLLLLLLLLSLLLHHVDYPSLPSKDEVVHRWQVQIHEVARRKGARHVE
jgi:hypothetical protein